MTEYTQAGKEMANRIFTNQGPRYGLGIERLCNELGELRSRVEALEAAAKPAESNDPAEPNSSLVEWVAGSLTTGLHSDARLAILAVADWFDQQGLFNTAAKLRQELG